jgi:hypothetical protein
LTVFSKLVSTTAKSFWAQSPHYITKIGKNHKNKTGKCWGHILSQIPAKFHEISLNFEEI